MANLSELREHFACDILYTSLLHSMMLALWLQMRAHRYASCGSRSCPVLLQSVVMLTSANSFCCDAAKC